MGKRLFANNAASTLAAPIGASDTTLLVLNGSYFPTPENGDYFMATITGGTPESAWEVVKVTGRTGNQLTVVRGQEGTAAAAWVANSKVELRLTAGILQDFEATRQTVGTAVTTRTIQARLGEIISVKDDPYGAKGDGVTNDTAAIQAALNDSLANLDAIIPVYVPAGQYLVDQISLPVGVQLICAGGNLEDLDKANTRFIQNSAVSPFRFAGYSGGNGYYYWHGRVSGFAILGNNTFASGFGLDGRDVSGNGVIFTDQTLIENLTVRGMPEGGINLPHGALPLTIRNVKFLWNGGPGIKCTRVSQFQGVHFANISGDGNVGGLIALNSMSSNDNFLITSLKSECRVNSLYGGGAGQQPNAIVITGSPDVAIAIHGANHICSVPDGSVYVKPGSLVYITDANIPTISWSGVAIRVRGTDTGTDPGVIEQSTNKIPYRITAGYFGNKDRVDRSIINGVYRTFGPVDSYQAKNIEAPGDQIAGTTPGKSFYETDAAADSKAWLMVASGGVFSIRAIKDDGSLGQILAQFTRTQMQVGPDSAGTYFRVNGTSQTTAPAAGAASALPATPAGYITININGTDRKVAYY